MVGMENCAMEMTMNPNSIVPLYAQIVEQLQYDIKNGMYSKNGRLPPRPNCLSSTASAASRSVGQ